MGSAEDYGASGGATSRSAWVYDQLRNAIQEGRYARGARIREEVIARDLGVSRTPVREALSRLQASGMLEIGPGGLAVAQFSRRQIIELYVLREILEGAAARFAAQHASPTEMADLDRLMETFAKFHNDPRRLAQVNRELHSSIYESAHNRYLTRTLHELQDSLALLQNTTFTVPGRPQQASIEHARIIDAIKRRDPDEAEAAARDHIRSAHEARLMMLSESGAA